MRNVILALLLALVLGVGGHSTQPRTIAQTGDAVTLSSADPGTRLPLTPGTTGSVSYGVEVTLTSAATAPLRLVGRADGQGDPIPLGPDLTVMSGTNRMDVTGSYSPPASGVRWLVVQAVLGSPDLPLAQTTLPPYVVMAPLTSDSTTAYYAPNLSPDLAQAYLNAYDAAVQEIGTALDSFTNTGIPLFLTSDRNMFEQTMLAWGYTPAEAAVRKASLVAVNRDNGILLNVAAHSSGADIRIVGHEYAETRFVALQPGNQGAGWFWDGLADTLGLQLAADFPNTQCDIDALRIHDWVTALNAIRDGTYQPLSDITTAAQWAVNYQHSALQYAEGYTAVEYWQNHFGLSSLIQFVQTPKSSPDDFAGAVQAVLGISTGQFEQDYFANMRTQLDQPPPPVPVSVHLAAGGITPQTAISLTSYYGNGGQGRAFTTSAPLMPGDYNFIFNSDGSVDSIDNAIKLTESAISYPPAQDGRLYVDINYPGYQGQAQQDGREILHLVASHGRAGVDSGYFSANSSKRNEFRSGDCLAPWPDGNRISSTATSSP